MWIREGLCDGTIRNTTRLTDIKSRRDSWAWPFSLGKRDDPVSHIEFGYRIKKSKGILTQGRLLKY